MAKNNHDSTIVTSIPACDFCGTEGVDRAATVDGRTNQRGAWANMCGPHFEEFGVGLGLGKGQVLQLDSELVLG